LGKQEVLKLLLVMEVKSNKISEEEGQEMEMEEDEDKGWVLRLWRRRRRREGGEGRQEEEEEEEEEEGRRGQRQLGRGRRTKWTEGTRAGVIPPPLLPSRLRLRLYPLHQQR